jgi:ferric-dicitrate binding protein FerR (iron transport regulator)
VGTHSRPVLQGPQALTEGNSVGKSNQSRRLPGREKEEDEMALSMRRIFSVIAVAALMAAMLAAMAVPAFAEIACTWEEDYWTGERTWVCYDYGY